MNGGRNTAWRVNEMKIKIAVLIFCFCWLFTAQAAGVNKAAPESGGTVPGTTEQANAGTGAAATENPNARTQGNEQAHTPGTSFVPNAGTSGEEENAADQSDGTGGEPQATGESQTKTGTRTDDKKAGEKEILDTQKAALDTDKLESAAREYTDGASVDKANLQDGLSKLLKTGGENLQGIFKSALRSGALLLLLVLLCQVAAGFFEGNPPDVLFVAGTLAITVAAASDVTSLIGLARETIDSMDTFSKVLLPTLTAAVAATGAPTAAAARQMATMLFSDVLLTLISRLLLPLVYAFIALCGARAAFGNEGLDRIAGLVKWGVTISLTVLLMLFTGYLTVSGAIAGSADATTIKAAKFAVSSTVPVVGSILSDAAESILAGATLLKNAVGVIGMLAILGMCLIPFLQIAMHYLVYKITAALAATVADNRLSKLIDGIGGAFGLVLGMTGACTVLLLISVVSAISAVKGG